MAENGLTDSLLGRSGTVSGGLLGGSGLTPLTRSLFGGIDRNATLTDDWNSGVTWVGERGPEIVNLPAHLQVMPNGAATYPGAGTGQSMRQPGPVTVNFNVKALSPEAFHASRDQIASMLSQAVAKGQRNA